MARYRAKDALDDAILTDGDEGYIGFETRRHSTLLEPSVARLLRNQRLDNRVATDRKGVDRLTADLFVESTPLTLPFDLGTEISVTSITRASTTATVTLAATPATAYATGDTVEIAGANESDYNGEFVITVTNATVFTYTVSGSPSTPATGTITATNHPILAATPDGGFASVLFSDVESNKDYIALATRDDLQLIDADNPSSPITVQYPGSEQVEETDIIELEQVNNGLIIFRGSLKTALEWDGSIVNTDAISVTAITRVSTTATVTTQGDHNYVNGDTVAIAGADQSGYNINAIITSTGDETFTYEVLTAPTTPATGTITATKVPQFKVRGDATVSTLLSMPNASFGMYHPLARLVVPVESSTVSLSSLTRSGTTVTATTSIDHGFRISDRATIALAADNGYNGTHEVTGVTANTFTYTIVGTPTTPDTASTSTVEIAVRDEFIVSDIYDHRTYDPAFNLFRINRGFRDFLVGLQNFQNDNIIALYRNSIHIVTGMSLPTLENSSIFQVTDEVGCIARKTAVVIGERLLFLSEQGVYSILITPQINLKGQDVPLSLDIEDDIDGINWAKASKSVAVYFNNRYYLAVPSGEKARTNLTVTTDGATVTVTTTESHGFNEGDSVVMAGMTPSGFDATATITLVDRDTFTYANSTSGPLTVVGTSTKAASARNDTIFIYNFLNAKWESMDTFGAEGSFVDNFVVANKDGKKRLFATSKEGALQLHEELEHDEIGPAGGPFVNTEIDGQLITRRFTLGNPFEVKKFAKGSMDVKVLNDVTATITSTSQNPDSTSVSKSLSFSATEDHYVPFRVNKRGRGCEFQIDSSAGRMEKRQITIQGTVQQRSNKTYS